MKKLNKNSNNWLAILCLLLITFISYSCEEAEDDIIKDEENTEDSTNTGGGNTANLTNNVITDGSASVTLDKYTITYVEGEVNTGGDYYEIYAFAGETFASSNDYLRVFVDEIPSSANTYSWQAEGNSGGAIKADEFFIQAKIEGKTWYGVYTAEAWATSGSMETTVDGDKVTLAFSEIELSDNYISINVTETKKISGKITMDKNSVAPNQFFDLLD